MTQKRKGSTTAPTVSSHGSNPEQGIKNMQSNSTERAQSATGRPDLFKMVMDMETPICDAENAISIMYRILHDNFSEPHTAATGSPNRWILSESDISDMFFVANLINKYIGHIKKNWNEALEAGR